MPTFRPRARIEAVQWRGDNLAELRELHPDIFHDHGKRLLRVPTILGYAYAAAGDWVLVDHRGGIHIRHDADFTKQFEPVAD